MKSSLSPTGFIFLIFIISILVISLVAQASVIKKLVQKIANEYNAD